MISVIRYHSLRSRYTGSYNLSKSKCKIVQEKMGCWGRNSCIVNPCSFVVTLWGRILVLILEGRNNCCIVTPLYQKDPSKPISLAAGGIPNSVLNGSTTDMQAELVADQRQIVEQDLCSRLLLLLLLVVVVVVVLVWEGNIPAPCLSCHCRCRNKVQACPSWFYQTCTLVTLPSSDAFQSVLRI